MASEPWIAEHLRYRGILCVVMVIAGVISLGGGVALLWFGAKDTSIWVDAPSFKLTGTGLGGLV